MEIPDSETEDIIINELYMSQGDIDNCYLFYSQHKNVVSKMKKMKAFSRGLISLFFIQLALDVTIFGAMIISCCCLSEEKLANCTLSYLVLSGITSVLHLLFFILFSANYFMIKKGTKGFIECDITSYLENCKKSFICDLIFMFFNFWLNCSWWVKK